VIGGRYTRLRYRLAFQQDGAERGDLGFGAQREACGSFIKSQGGKGLRPIRLLESGPSFAKDTEASRRREKPGQIARDREKSSPSTFGGRRERGVELRRFMIDRCGAGGSTPHLWRRSIMPAATRPSPTERERAQAAQI
jgi:hypothetical protein